MLVNEVKLNGRVYRCEVRQTNSGKPITHFGLCFYNGKDPEGKAKYAFIDCKAFEPKQMQDKTDVVVIGHLVCNEWVDRNGQSRKDMCLNVNSIQDNYFDKKEEPTFDDDCPF